MSSRSQTEQIVTLKDRVKELEAQVADYKRRLESLRKAKSTTVVKRDREILEVGAPNLGQKRESLQGESSKVADLQKDLEAVKKKHADELARAKKGQAASCNHEEEIRRLKENVEVLESNNAVLVIENEEIKSQYEDLLIRMSIKEAEWCEKEEQLILKLKQNTFGEKYAEWMAKTEAKIQELENTNALLRQYLKNSGRGDLPPMDNGGATGGGTGT